MWGVSCLKEKNTFFVTDFTLIWHGWLLRSFILNTFSYFICNCYCKITAFRVSYLRHHEVKNVFFVDLEIQVFRKRSMATITAFWISTLNNSRTSFLMQVCKTFLFSFLFSFFFLAIYPSPCQHDTNFHSKSVNFIQKNRIGRHVLFVILFKFSSQLKLELDKIKRKFPLHQSICNTCDCGCLYFFKLSSLLFHQSGSKYWDHK